MGLIPSRFRRKRRAEQRMSLEEWWLQQAMQYGGLGLPFQQTLVNGPTEEIGQDFAGIVRGAYKSNGVVFACMLSRLLLFSEARFAFRKINDGRPGRLFATDGRGARRGLSLLSQPWPGGTTGDLLARVIQDADFAGNSFTAYRGDRLARLRPDWVTILLGSPNDPQVDAWDVDAEVIGYAYQPGGKQGKGQGREPSFFLANEVAHFAPIPDPEACYRGMSWLTPVLRDVMGDQAAAQHKLKFFENGATVNLAVVFDQSVKTEQFNKWIEMIEGQHAGALNAYKTLYLGGGAEPKPVGADMKQLEFKATIGAGETRIAAAAGVPPVIVGLSEGLAASTYSNYAQARRRFADGTMRPLWRNFAGSFSRIIDVPAGAELWYDDRDIAFLQEDRKDAAEVANAQAAAIKQLVDAGYDPDSVVDAVDSGDLTRLKHTGLYSVQLQPSGTGSPSNGNGSVPNGAAAASKARELLAPYLSN